MVLLPWTSTLFSLLITDEFTVLLMRINSNQKYVRLLGCENWDERVPIENIGDIFYRADRLRDAVASYENIDV